MTEEEKTTSEKLQEARAKKDIFPTTTETSERTEALSQVETDNADIIVSSELTKEEHRLQELKEYHKRDTINSGRGVWTHWELYTQENCYWTEQALELLKKHGEKSVVVRPVDRNFYQQHASKGRNYTPLIFKNGSVFGSYGELESYYKKTFYGDFNTTT